jgi:hypothetical protein
MCGATAVKSKVALTCALAAFLQLLGDSLWVAHPRIPPYPPLLGCGSPGNSVDAVLRLCGLILLAPISTLVASLMAILASSSSSPYFWTGSTKPHHLISSSVSPQLALVQDRALGLLSFELFNLRCSRKACARKVFTIILMEFVKIDAHLRPIVSEKSWDR